MSKFCVECGAELGAGSFCGECGSAVEAPTTHETESTSPQVHSVESQSPPPSADAADSSRSSRHGRRAGLIAAVAAVLVLVAGVAVAAVHNSGEAADDAAAAAAASEARAQAAADAQAKAKHQKIRAKARARAQRDAEPPSTVIVTPGVAAPLAGDWSGSMDDGKYYFSMFLSESGGGISGSMTQYSNATGGSGTEQLAGSRSGNTVYLQGTSWSSDTPAGWSLDTIEIFLSPDGDSFTGTYGCDGCSGTFRITGTRGYGD